MGYPMAESRVFIGDSRPLRGSSAGIGDPRGDFRFAPGKLRLSDLDLGESRVGFLLTDQNFRLPESGFLLPQCCFFVPEPIFLFAKFSLLRAQPGFLVAKRRFGPAGFRPAGFRLGLQSIGLGLQGVGLGLAGSGFGLPEFRFRLAELDFRQAGFRFAPTHLPFRLKRFLFAGDAPRQVAYQLMGRPVMCPDPVVEDVRRTFEALRQFRFFVSDVVAAGVSSFGGHG
jgi:hypothetical protein